MKTHDFYFDLPQELIAQTPLERRDGSRLLVLDKSTGAVEHRHFYDLPEYLHPGDCLILNNSRVLPARLLGHRQPGGGACEILLLIDRGDNVWECLVRPGKKLRKGARVSFGDGELTAEIVEELPDGLTVVGGRPLHGGVTLDAFDDHRIAMLAAVLAGGCNAPVTVLGAQCTSKSYPSFWQTLDTLKGDRT